MGIHMSKKVTVIRAGSVGSTIAYTLSVMGIADEIVMIDINENKVLGEALDIRQGLPFCSTKSVYAGGYAEAENSDIVVITSGVPRKAGQTRLELAQVNVDILKGIMTKITKYAPDAIYLLVANPVDILTYCTIKLSGFPAGRVLGSGTVLDTARLKYHLGQQLCVDSRSIHAFIIGEHGDSELAVWSSANVSGIDLEDFHGLCSSCREVSFNQTYENVRDSAYEVIERKGATYYGIAMAVTKIVLAIIRDEHSVLPVSGYVDGHYGLSDLCIGVPSIVGSNGIEKVLDIPLNEEENERLINSVKTLKKVISELDI